MQLLGSAEKLLRPHKPCYAPLQKISFINAVNLFMGVNEVCINIRVTVSVRVSATVRVILV